MSNDPIVVEVREARQKLAARFNHDIRAIAESARKRQRRSGHRVVSLAGRRRLIVREGL